MRSKRCDITVITPGGAHTFANFFSDRYSLIISMQEWHVDLDVSYFLLPLRISYMMMLLLFSFCFPYRHLVPSHHAPWSVCIVRWSTPILCRSLFQSYHKYQEMLRTFTTCHSRRRCCNPSPTSTNLLYKFVGRSTTWLLGMSHSVIGNHDHRHRTQTRSLIKSSSVEW